MPETNTQEPQAPDQGQSQAPERKPLAQLAKETFGGDFFGKVPEPEPKPKPRVEGDDVSPDEGIEEPPDTQPDEEAAQSQPAAEKEGEEVTSLRELSEQLDVDPTWLEDLKVDVVVNDKPSQVPLKDIVAAYRMNQAADERLEKAKEHSQAQQQEYAARNAALDQQFAVAAKLVELNEQAFTQEFTRINWDELQRNDPALWSAERVRMGERNNQIQQMKNAIATQYQQAQTQRQQEMATNYSEHVQKQSQLLMEAIPKISSDWGDASKAPQAKARLADYLLTQGFTKEDVMGAADHRLILVAEKARLWDEARGKVDLSKKRIRNVPKVLKPGASKPPGAINLEAVKNARAKLAKSGKLDDALAVLKAQRRG